MKMKNFFNLMGTIALLITMGAIEAQATCQVYIDKPVPCKGSPLPLRTTFNDGDGLAKVSPKRCIARAYEYHAYCGYTNKVGVYTYFHNGVNYSTAAGNWGDSKYNAIFAIDKNNNFIHLGTHIR